MPSSAERIIAGRYRLLDSLGRGGMGIVWRARDEYLERDVAMKEILLPSGLDDATRAGMLERFVREAKAAAHLDHPAIINVYDVVTEDDLPWIVMRLVRGRSLDQLVRDDGPLPPDRVAAIGLQMLDALGTAHAAGILHRDVTPRNVLIGDGDRIVLTDFGIAAMAGATALTQTGTLIGSPGYIAPERLRGRPAGPESDLWSLGAVLYFAAEGKPAYSADEAPALIGMVLTEEPEPPVQAGPLAPVLEGLLIKDPAERLSAEVTRRRLRAVTEASEVTGRALGELTTVNPASRRHPETYDVPEKPYGPVPVQAAYSGGRPPEGPYGAGFAPTIAEPPIPSPPGYVPGTRPVRSNASVKPATIALICALVVFVGAAAVVVNVAWNPFRIIGEGRFSAFPACGGITSAALDKAIPQPRHAVVDHCEWWSLANGNLDLQVLSTTRYTRSWWHSAEDRAHSRMNELRAADPLRSELVVGDEKAVTEESGEDMHGSGSAVIWFRVSNVVVKMMVTDPSGSAAAYFRVIGAAREIVRSLPNHR
ncbi:serine/threonine-protein kinase [Actinoallomurus rhizosphaericola]|uniref:serine/threonine-protein kinase n=1 Tax=Actinoallomurus rhizosphaericola TaxID=2952536 RepID=UPI002090CB4E|nr:serine/threonine-protein kinase [Actinoallomurus rhizosphaericola]MCO5992367.1 serine/threonine protein kinase [Actinoallomurus rhizosphaericola]